MSIRRLSDSSIKAKNVGGAGPRLDGRWAVLSGGTVTTVVNADGTIDQVHTFTASDTLRVLSPGFARVLIVGGGSAGFTSNPGSGGDVRDGIHLLPAGAHAVTVGVSGPDGSSDPWGRPSSIGSLIVTSASGQGANYNQSSGAGGTIPTSGGPNPGPLNTGLVSDISGAVLEYAKANQGSPRTNFGDGRDGTTATGSAGIVIVRVRKSP